MRPLSLGISGGLIWGISLFVMTWVSMWTGYAGAFLGIIESIYPGYEVSGIGSWIGLGYGFVDAFIFFWLLAAIHNCIKRCCRKCHCCHCDKKKPN
jgi:hypothetical protein